MGASAFSTVAHLPHHPFIFLTAPSSVRRATLVATKTREAEAPMGLGKAPLALNSTVAVRQGLPFRLLLGTFHKSRFEFQRPDYKWSGQENKHASTSPILALNLRGERPRFILELTTLPCQSECPAL